VETESVVLKLTHWGSVIRRTTETGLRITSGEQERSPLNKEYQETLERPIPKAAPSDCTTVIKVTYHHACRVVGLTVEQNRESQRIAYPKKHGIQHKKRLTVRCSTIQPTLPRLKWRGGETSKIHSFNPHGTALRAGSCFSHPGARRPKRGRG